MDPTSSRLGRAVVGTLLAAVVGSGFSVATSASTAADPPRCGGNGGQAGVLHAQPSGDASSNQVAFSVAGGVTGTTYAVQVEPDRYFVLDAAGAAKRHTYAEPGEYDATFYAYKRGCPLREQAVGVVANPVATYAPTMVFHPGEQYFPDTVDAYLDSAVLVHDLPNFRNRLSSAGCRDEVLGVGPDAVRPWFTGARPGTVWENDEPALALAKLGAAATDTAYGATVHTITKSLDPVPADVDSCRPTRTGYLAHDPGARKTGDMSSDDDGLTLSAASAAQSVLEGDASLTRAQLYVDYDPGHYVEYWAFYPYNHWTRPHGAVDEQHEGDWERVAVRLGGPAAPRMTQVGYYQQSCGIETHKRSEVDLDDATHPLVYAALGGHASYPTAGEQPHEDCFVDPSSASLGDLTGAGDTFRPWQRTDGLAVAQDQPWFGFEGAWGDPRPSVLKHYGSQGPGADRPGVSVVWTRGAVPAYPAGADDPTTARPDLDDPVIESLTIDHPEPTSPEVSYALEATDATSGVASMRMRVTGQSWSGWNPYQANGQVQLGAEPGSYVIRFQVRDAAGHVSKVKKTEPIEVEMDEVAPQITDVTLTPTGGGTASYTITVDDPADVTEMLVYVDGESGEWQPFVSSGSVSVAGASSYGEVPVAFQVRDAALNESDYVDAGTVANLAAVSLLLQQVDNNDNVRSCGAESNPCSNIVQRFRTTITSEEPVYTDLLLRGWRLINGTWTQASFPMLREPIDGQTEVTMDLTANLLPGLWRFETEVEATDVTTAAASNHQYLTVPQPPPPPDTQAPVITGATISHPGNESPCVSFTLNATDNVGVVWMRAVVNGEPRAWNGFATSGCVVIDGWGRFGIGFQVMDAAGNVSVINYVAAINRRAPVSLSLVQVDNNGNVRSCGSQSNPCTPVVKRFRTTISSAVLPPGYVAFRAERFYDGGWHRTTQDPFLHSAITGPVVYTAISANLAPGLWRFWTQVPVSDYTQFGESVGFQYMRF